MQTFISKYGLAAHLALLAVTPLFLSAFCGATTIGVSLLWLSFSALLWLLMEPSRRANERLHEARTRVRDGMLRDPLFWLFVLLLVFTGIRALNGGVAKVYDVSGRDHAWILRPASCGFLPGHAGEAGFLPFATTVALFVLLQACRQALGKSARIALATMISLFAGVAAIVFVIACRLDHEGAMMLSGAHRIAGAGALRSWEWTAALPSAKAAPSFYISSVGNAFGLCLLGSIVSAAGLFECKWNKLLLLFSFSMGACWTGLFYFATPFVFVLYSALAVLVFVFCFVYLMVVLRSSIAFKFVMTVLLAGLVPMVVILCVAPEGMTAAHAAIFQGDPSPRACFFPAGHAELRAALSAQAASFWESSRWLGHGVGSFPLDLWLSGGASSIAPVPAPLNGWRLLLAERGIIGAVALVLPLAFMAFTFVRRLIGALGRHTFLPLCVLGLTGLAATAATSAFDCSFLRSDTMLIAGVFFALAASAFPARKVQRPVEDAVE